MQTRNTDRSERMAIVVIGHVDHGKSTVLGRLLADTNSLPVGKLDQVREYCQRNARPFEYAFLLDGLRDEQAQGITIDSARCFFMSSKRDYVLIDAPGHLEFLKNMVSGAARAEAALLVVDAKEGVRENTKRHGYLMSLLGVRQTTIVINKMDLVDYSSDVFAAIVAEYSAFLERIGIKAQAYIPVSARLGDNIVHRSNAMPWYQGPTVLDQLDLFEKEPPAIDNPLRLPVQDVYRFTEAGDDRRIFAGRIETGRPRAGEDVILWPSGKRSRIATLEGFPSWPYLEAVAGQSIGLTLEEQIYIEPGQILCKPDQPQPQCGNQLLTHLFWLGRRPMLPNKRYKLKLGTASVSAWLRQINYIMDASDLTTSRSAKQVERYQVAQCIIETLKPLAFDTVDRIAQTSRFVIVDNYEISGGGIISEGLAKGTDRTQRQVELRQRSWRRTSIDPQARAARYNQRATVVILCGPEGVGKDRLANALEKSLFDQGRFVYYLGLSNSPSGIEPDIDLSSERDQVLHRPGEICHMFADAGLFIITSISDLDQHELRMLATLARPYDCLVIHVGKDPVDDLPVDLDITDPEKTSDAVERICKLLSEREYLLEYYL
ncbi:MAG: GTP-binding protein [Sedimentisphaerales bacterium]|nr:GTP-binding protein [Sedimentisphaerales bacterium]